MVPVRHLAVPDELFRRARGDGCRLSRFRRQRSKAIAEASVLSCAGDRVAVDECCVGSASRNTFRRSRFCSPRLPLEQFWRGRAVFTRLPDAVLEDLQPFLDRQEPTATRERTPAGRNLAHRSKIGFGGAGAGSEFFANVYRTSRDISESEPRDYYAQGAAWMRTNIPAGQIVFNTDWDDFPRLFYFDSSHAYVSGLDPTYLLDRNAELSKLYDRITTR